MIILGSNFIWIGRAARRAGPPPEGWDGESPLPHPGYYAGFQALTTAEVLAAYPDLGAHVITPEDPAHRLAGDGEPPWDTVIVRVLTETEEEAQATLSAVLGFNPWEVSDAD